MNYELEYIDANDTVEIAFESSALFEQYDEAPAGYDASADGYENLYPTIS